MANILVLGGRGYVGSAICKELRNHKVYTCDRHKGSKRHIVADISSVASLTQAFEKMDVVINLVGLSPLRTPEKGQYEKVHVQGVKNIITACKDAKVSRLVHMSVLGADSRATTSFLRTRGRGEKLIESSRLNWTIVRPSIIFDKNNELLQLLSKSAYTLVFPDIPARIQPVYRGDVAKMFRLVVEKKVKAKIMELGGPERMSLIALARKVYHSKGCPCFAIPLGFIKPGMHLAALTGLFGIGDDQITSLTLDNITNSRIMQRHIKPTRFSSWIKRVKI